MTNSWKQLLEDDDTNSNSRDCSISLVVCSNSLETQHTFLRQFLATDSKQQSTDMIGFISEQVSFNNHADDEEDNVTLNIYTMHLPLSSNNLDSLKIFIDSDVGHTKWLFLLDWIFHDKKRWLRDLVDSYRLLEGHGFTLTEGSSTVMCLNSSHIRELERNTTSWNMHKFEFMHQSLRSFCLLNRSSLIAADGSTDADTVREILKLVLRKKTEKENEMVNLEKLFIPWGTDSEGKIKTIDGDFPVSEALNQGFISEHFETIVPGKNFDKEDQPAQDLTLNQESLDRIFDVQGELVKLYNVQKTAKSTNPGFHKPTQKDYQYVFTPSKQLQESKGLSPTSQIPSTAASEAQEKDLIDGFLEGIVQKNINATL